MNKSELSSNYIEQLRTPVEVPYVKMGLDIIRHFKTTTKGNMYIIVCIDYFTLWTEAESYPIVTSQDVIDFLNNAYS